jgi:predicted nucleic acid-binding protein
MNPAGDRARCGRVLIAATALRHDAVVVHNHTDFLTAQRTVAHFTQLRISPGA